MEWLKNKRKENNYGRDLYTNPWSLIPNMNGFQKNYRERKKAAEGIPLLFPNPWSLIWVGLTNK